MNTDRIEYLLEQLVARQSDLIERLDYMETKLSDLLTEANSNLSDIGSQLMQANSSLQDMESRSIETSSQLSMIQTELTWWGDDPTLAKEVLSSLNNIETAVSLISP